MVRHGLMMSPVHEVLLEESIIGWKEYEMEVMRDVDDNVVIICSIENFDPMGVHTGDSITVAPAQTLTDKEYQRMRDASIAVMREIGVETGGSNIQFAIHPQDGRMVVIEMNPRVSRSSALASKATGFPIAKIAAKLAVGYRLHEMPNDITRETLACFEPTIDYVVTKIPRLAFEKFPEADPTLTMQMKSVGETMAIGRTFKESFQKALRGLEIGQLRLRRRQEGSLGHAQAARRCDEIRRKLAVPNDERVWFIRYAIKAGMSVEEIHQLTDIDPWFLRNISRARGDRGRDPRGRTGSTTPTPTLLRKAKRNGFSDRQLATMVERAGDGRPRSTASGCGIVATFKSVDTCAAEFEAYTPYYYSTYEDEDETPAKPPGRTADHDPGRRAQPHRPGHRVRLLLLPRQLRPAGAGHRDRSWSTRTPRPSRTDYDTSDCLFFEPLTTEDVLNICDRDAARRRDRAVRRADAAQSGPRPGKRPACRSSAPASTRSKRPRTARSSRPCCTTVRPASSRPTASPATWPRPATRRPRSAIRCSCGPATCWAAGRWKSATTRRQLMRYVAEAFDRLAQGQPVLIDKFLEDAIEVDVDAICRRAAGRSSAA